MSTLPDPTTAAPGHDIDERDVRKVAIVSLVGSSVEWFDFFLFGTAAALVFPALFFPADDPVMSVLASFGVFGVGFLARPLGGVVWGHFGDTLGRKKAFVLALGLMAVASFLIGVLPTYATIGVAAPILLTVLRFAQGMAVGGQWGGAALMATESAPANKRGIYGSFAQLGVPIGVLLGLTGYFFLFVLMGTEAFASYGWRIPFVVSVLFVGVVLYTKNKLEDTPAFKNVQRRVAASAQPAVSRSPILEVLARHWDRVLLAGGAYIIVNATFYLYITFILDYGVRTLGLEFAEVLLPLTVAMALMIPVLSAFAALSDRVGRRLLYLVGAALTAAWSFPAFILIDSKTFLGILVGLAVGMACLALMYGPMAAYFTELFPPEVRYSGASLAYQLGAVLGGGVAPLAAVWLVETSGTTAALSLLQIGLSVLAIVCLVALSGKNRAEDARGEHMLSATNRAAKAAK